MNLPCRKCGGLLYRDAYDPLFKCFQCGRCYYTFYPVPVTKGPKHKRVTHGGWHNSVKVVA